MNPNVDINISIDELHRRILESKARLINYVENLLAVYDKLETSDLPESSERIVLGSSDSLPIIIYKEPSKEAYRDLLSKALLFLKLEYAIYEVIGQRLGRLRGHGFKAMVRYFGDAPSFVVISLDGAERQ